MTILFMCRWKRIALWRTMKRSKHMGRLLWYFWPKCQMYIRGCNTIVTVNLSPFNNPLPRCFKSNLVCFSQDCRGYEWQLDDPPLRPHIDSPPRVSIPSTPARRVMSVTRVVVPTTMGGCQSAYGGSLTCSIIWDSLFKYVLCSKLFERYFEVKV